jgi:multicomponent Na+:H+ antiporter subunit A
MGVLAAVLAPFVLAGAAPWLARRTAAAGWLLALLPAALFLFFAAQLPAVAAGALRVSWAWAPELGVHLSFLVDGLSLLFALLITGIGALVLVYAGGYLAGSPALPRLYAYLLLFLGSMLGVVLADNLLLLVVFWEATSVSSYLLIGLHHEKAESRAAAWQALVVTFLGGQALLVAVLLLGFAAGTMEASALVAAGDVVRDHPLYLAILVLVLGGAFTKSAQVPFHFWLPDAMVAPTPVSAYLHSATMVKAGVYLLARLAPVLGGTPAWTTTLVLVGGATAVVGAVVAIEQRALKRILAYATVSALGIMVLLIGLGTAAAATALVVFLLGHALYKGALFLVVGAVDHQVGAPHVPEVGGLGRYMPWTAAAALAAGLSMAGLPPFFGFIGKELAYDAALAGAAGAAVSPGAAWLPLLVAPALVAAFALLVGAAAIVALAPFVGALTPAREPGAPAPHEAGASLLLVPALLAAAGVMAGLAPGLAAGWLVAPAVAAIRPGEAAPPLALWHGFNLPLLLSGVSLAAGVGVYLLRPRLAAAVAALGGARWGAGRGYERLDAGLRRLAAVQTRVLQSGYLPRYVLFAAATTVALPAAALLLAGDVPLPRGFLEARPFEAGIAGLILTAALVAAAARSLILVIIALAVVGFGVAILFVLFGAPDLAMAQFLVETLTVVLFVLIFFRLRKPAAAGRRAMRVRDAVVALAGGAVVTVLVYGATQLQLHPAISSHFVELSAAEGHGRNVVNLILMDFRALDTLGEIIVLAAAGVGVYALLRLRPGADRP